VHLLRTFANVARLLDDPGEERVAAEAASLVRDRDGVLLGALLHDIGKTGEGGHVAVGREVAARALDRMRLPTATRDLAHFMVAEHLLLPDTATRRDLEDDDLVLDVASRVGEPERLAALYLLAVGDAVATGPAAWTPWRQTLIRELVAKVQRVLERGEAGPQTAERLTERADALRSLLPDLSEDEMRHFLLRMPRSYVLTLPPARIAEHHAIVAPPLGALEVRTLTGVGERPGTYALTVVAADRPGLLSLIAGALSLAGLSILSAQVFTTEDGAAVDVFDVEGAFEPEISEERWREFRTTLRKAIEGRLALDHRVEAKRRHYPPPRHGFPLEVRVHPDASDFFTVVEVGAADRIGLLFDVTRTFAELRLDVHLAKVATFGARVVDAFYVRDVLGRKLDEEQVAELERALRARLEDPAD
jgi:[protein-PII] uridylyltransferase